MTINRNGIRPGLLRDRLDEEDVYTIEHLSELDPDTWQRLLDCVKAPDESWSDDDLENAVRDEYGLSERNSRIAVSAWRLRDSMARWLLVAGNVNQKANQLSTYHRMARFSEGRAYRLKEREREFVRRMILWTVRSEPTEKQAGWLEDIFVRLGGVR